MRRLAQPHADPDADHQSEARAGKQAAIAEWRTGLRRGSAACRTNRWRRCLCGRQRVSDFPMAGRSIRGFCFSRDAFGARHARLVFGLEARRRRVARFRLLLGTALRFPRRLFFGCHARQGRGFRNLLGAQFFVRQIGRASLGIRPLAGQAGEFFLFVGPCIRRDCKFGSREFSPLGVGQRALFSLDPRAQCDFGQAFDMRLLRCRGLGRRFGGSTTDGMFRGKALGLQPPLRGRCLLGGLRQPQLGGGTGPLFSTSAGKCASLGSPLAVRRVCRGDRITRNALLALPLQIHQSRQNSAQICAPHSGSGFKRPVVAA